MSTWRTHLTKNFFYFLTARVSGSLSNQMMMVALGWQMYDLTGSAWDLGLVGLFQFVPALLLTLPAGHIADRVSRGWIFAGSMLLQTIAALILLIATDHHFISRDLILVASVAMGIARAFQMPAQQALIPLLVPPVYLSKAMAISSSGLQAAVICGPALGGLLDIAGSEYVYSVSTVLFLLAGGTMLAVNYEQPPNTEKTTLRTMFAGFRHVWNNKILLGAISLDLFAVLFSGATALLPIFARDILGTGPEGLGLLRAAPAIGALVMSVLILRYPLQRRTGPLLLTSVALFGASTVVFGLSTHFGLSMLALIATGAADTISSVVRQTLVQAETPDAIRGRVSAVNSIFVGASNQLGEFESGAVAVVIGAVGSVVFGGIASIVVAILWIWLFPALARRDRLITQKKCTA